MPYCISMTSYQPSWSKCEWIDRNAVNIFDLSFLFAHQVSTNMHFKILCMSSRLFDCTGYQGRCIHTRLLIPSKQVLLRVHLYDYKSYNSHTNGYVCHCRSYHSFFGIWTSLKQIFQFFSVFFFFPLWLGWGGARYRPSKKFLTDKSS